MQSSSTSKVSTEIEEEYELLKKRLYSQFFKGFIAFAIILLSNEALRVMLYADYVDLYPLLASIGFMGLALGVTKVMENSKEKIMTLFFFCHYVVAFLRTYRGGYEYLNHPVDAYYTNTSMAMYEGIICARIPRFDHQVMFSIGTLFLRLVLIAPNDYVPIFFHVILIGAKLFLENHREVHNKHLFQIYLNSKEQLMKFKNLVVRDFPQGIAIVHKNLDKYLFINDIFKSLNENYDSEICSQLDKFILKQNADGAEASHSPHLFAGPTTLLTLIRREFSGQQKDKKVSCMADHKLHANSRSKSVLGINLMDIVWDDEPAIAVITKDVTQQHNMMSLKIADAQKDEVLATVSHELRTPLNGMLGMIQIMEKKIHDSELLNYLSICKNSGTLLVSLVNSILDLNQIRANKLKLHFEEIDVENFLMGIVALFEFQCRKKGISLKVKTHPTTPPRVITDKNRLSQILINLVGNALKFTSHGCITITAWRSLDEPNYVSFSVQDTGIGIKDEDKEKLFKVFGRLENEDGVNRQGVGLGLNISNNLVRVLCDQEDSKGIKVESEYGRGSKFTFMLKNQRGGNYHPEDGETISNLQMHESDIKETHASTSLSSKMNFYSWRNRLGSDVFENQSPAFVPSFSRSQSPFSNSRVHTDSGIDTSQLSSNNKGGRDSLFRNKREEKPCVLIVDDNPFNVTVAEHMITALGYHVKSALSGEAAVNLLSQNHHRSQGIKMIFMDCQMPVMDGYETTRVLKEKMKKGEMPDIPVIALTANDSEKDKEKCKKVGMSEYLTKPLSEPKLKEIISRYINK